MSTVLLILAATVTIYLTALTFMMVLRVLYPFFSAAEDRKAYSFLYATTEPFLMPVRGVLSRIEFFASSPVDFTYIITVMLVMVVQLLLPSVY